MYNNNNTKSQAPELMNIGLPWQQQLNEYMLFNFHRDTRIKSKSVSFEYKKNGGTIENRTVVPYKIKSQKYLIGFDLNRNALRSFLVSNISNVRFEDE